MLAGASPNTNNLFANLEIHSCKGNPSEVSALNHRDWPSLAAVECPSISAAARSAAWRCSPRSGMPRRATAAPVNRLRVRYRSHSCRAHKKPARQLMAHSVTLPRLLPHCERFIRSPCRHAQEEAAIRWCTNFRFRQAIALPDWAASRRRVASSVFVGPHFSVEDFTAHQPRERIAASRRARIGSIAERSAGRRRRRIDNGKQAAARAAAGTASSPQTAGPAA
jgi:hypothetical protein